MKKILLKKMRKNWYLHLSQMNLQKRRLKGKNPVRRKAAHKKASKKLTSEGLVLELPQAVSFQNKLFYPV